MSEASEQFVASKRRVSKNFKELISSAEELVRAAGAYSGEGVASARSQLQAQLEVLKAQAAEAESNARDKCRQVSQNADAYVHDNPWNAVGLAAAVGFVVGILVSRR